jgi:hypothetical protein
MKLLSVKTMDYQMARQKLTEIVIMSGDVMIRISDEFNDDYHEALQVLSFLEMLADVVRQLTSSIGRFNSHHPSRCLERTKRFTTAVTDH